VPLSYGQHLGVEGSVVGLLVLDRWDQAEAAMEASVIGIRADPFCRQYQIRCLQNSVVTSPETLRDACPAMGRGLNMDFQSPSVP
jgi:hypothetical protein